MRICLSMAAFTSILLSVIVLSGGHVFSRLFTDDPGVVDIGLLMMRVIWILTAVPLRPEISTVAFSYPLTWTVTSLLFIVYYLRGNWLKRCRGVG